MNWKRIGLMLLACPVGAILGGCVIGVFVANPISLVVRAALERKVMSETTADVLVVMGLALAASGGGAGFVMAGRKYGRQEVWNKVLGSFFVVASLFVLLPEITAHPIPNIAMWLGFMAGGLITAIQKERLPSNQASHATSEPAPGAASSSREG